MGELFTRVEGKEDLLWYILEVLTTKNISGRRSNGL